MNTRNRPPFATKPLIALLLALATGFAAQAPADVFTLQSGFSGAQQVPANKSNGTASLYGVYDDESNILLYSISYRLDTNSTTFKSAALHGPALSGKAAPAVVPLKTTGISGRDSFFSGPIHLSAEQEAALKVGKTYISISSDKYLGGELRGQIAATLSPEWAVSVPLTPEANSSVALDGATPYGLLTTGYNPASKRLTVAVFYTGLTSNPLEAHIHGPAAPGEYGSRLFAVPLIPATKSGVIVSRFSIEHTHATWLENDLLYYCLKTPRNPGGELRGQLSTGSVRSLDLDGDALGAEAEAASGTDPNVRDSNGNSLEDGVELGLGMDPSVAGPYFDPTDTDHDLIPDVFDAFPTNPDHDGDRFLDGYELAAGTDPNSVTSRPRLGDINNDGRVDSIDAIVGTALFLNVSVPFETYRERGDVNRDGKFDNVDFILLFNYTLGVVPTLPTR